MITQAPLDIHIENLLAFVQTAGLPAHQIHDAPTLSESYRHALESLQNRKSKGRYQATHLVVSTSEATEFCRLLSDDALSMLDDKNQANVISEEYDPLADQKAVLLDTAIQCLGTLSPEHKNLFDLLITDIFLMPSKEARGGSTSSAIGVIWANPKTTYRIPDIVEFLVHELTHHALFIDEHRHGHYDYAAIMNRERWAQSALLKVPRPLDKVIHSIIVATEIVMFRERCLGHPATPLVHPPTSKILTQISASLDSVDETVDKHTQDGQSLISPRVEALLHRVRDILASECLARHLASA